MTDLQTRCPDCDAESGAAHDGGCDVARCLVTGLQRLTCRDEHDCGADVWSGPWTPCRHNKPAPLDVKDISTPENWGNDWLCNACGKRMTDAELKADRKTMTDLRERLMDVIGVLDTDPALAVFADWLREQAGRYGLARVSALELCLVLSATVDGQRAS
jgi:hypothetical protein